jgi:hypothetical protein
MADDIEKTATGATSRVILVALISATVLGIAICRPFAQDMQNTFVEFKEEKQTRTYDLRTVIIIEPGKFVITETVIDNPDVTRFKLKVLDTLRPLCARPVGSYPAPTDILTLGPPDMPVQEIEVKLLDPSKGGANYRLKVVSWLLPYFGAGDKSYRCNPPGRTEGEEYVDHRNVILNGIKNKIIFDCNRGLQGELFDEQENDYMNIRLYPILNGTFVAGYYNGVCRMVTKKDPYIPE